MVVQHNITAMNANRMLGVTTKSQAKSTEKLSSGYKINRAADDAAGLAISEKMRKQIRGLTQASANAQDGISAVQTAEGALTEVHDMLQRMNELAVKAGNGTMSESDRESVQDEIDQLITEIDRVSETTKFNETYLLKGSGKNKNAGEVSGHIGAAGKDKVSDATITKAKGNIFSGTLDMSTATKLDAGTEDTATITYLDEDGNRRTKDVTFKTGNDAKGTAKNLADAINEDDDLKKIFKATSNADGKISVESKLNGTKTDDTRNAVQAIQFESVKADDTDARFNNFVGMAKSDMIDTTAAAWADMRTEAVGESYAIGIGNFDDITGAKKATTANFDLADGNSITINGKTYTYDAGKTNSDANSFKTLQELQNLLGDEYEVSAQITGTQVLKTCSTKGNAASDVIKTEEVEFTADLLKTSATVAVGSLQGSNFATQPESKALVANDTVVSDVKNMKLTINISEKSTVEQPSDVMNFSLQVGADTTEENKISVDIQSMSAKSLGVDDVIVTGSDSTNADEAVNKISDAIAKVSKQRSALGAIQNRLEHTINNLDNVVENTTSAESAIRDTDMATEMVRYSNNNILAQAGQAMLAQANQSNQGVLSLLG